MPRPELKKESYAIPLAEGMASAMHRFGCNVSDKPILLIHGSIEDSRIFHSRSGKGFAPYLAANGFDVFAPDMAGKGQSKPKIKKGFKHSQFDFISRDIDIYISHIRSIHPDKTVHLAAHSWGGVLLLAWMARYGKMEELGPSVFFASKRRISILSLRRLFMVDLMWTAFGELSTWYKGYLPAKTLGMGGDNEPAQFYRELNRWVYSRKWIGPDGFNYREALQSMELPPVLYLTGAADKVLGHPKDVAQLMRESGQSNAKYLKLGKDYGHAQDYGHIDILTHKSSVTDHFPITLKWLMQ